MAKKRPHDAQRSPFMAWFKEQFGRCPSNTKIHALRKEADVLAIRLHHVRDLLAREERLAQSMNSALLGWNAKRVKNPNTTKE